MTRVSAPIIVDAPQRSDKWYAARLGNATGSRFSDVLSYAKPTVAQIKEATLIYEEFDVDQEYIDEVSTRWPWKFCNDVGVEVSESAARMNYRRDIVTERITKMPADIDPFITADMRWGMMMEQTARLMYQTLTGNRIDDAPLMLHPTLLCGASPDGLVIDGTTGELGNLEIKNLKSRNHLYKIILADKVPDDYHDQIQGQMWIDDRDWCDFVGYDERVLEGLRIFIKRVERDSWFIDNVLEPEMRKFLEEADAEERKFYAIIKQRENKMHDVKLDEMEIFLNA